jgi:hypothetical protein
MDDPSAGPKRIIYGSGALGHVSGVDTNVVQPGAVYSSQVDSLIVRCAAKVDSDGTWGPDGKAQNPIDARSFISELRVLSHPAVRKCRNIVKILGLHWTLESLIRRRGEDALI